MKHVTLLFPVLTIWLAAKVQGVNGEGTRVVLNKADNTASIIDVKSGEPLATLATGRARMKEPCHLMVKRLWQVTMVSKLRETP